MLCDDGADDDDDGDGGGGGGGVVGVTARSARASSGTKVAASCARAGIDPTAALALCDEGLGMDVTEMCAYDYCF